MFTHKAQGAWDALASGLLEAGFTITASWPVNTEAEGSLHIKDKAAAKSTIFLVCRPRPPKSEEDTVYWEDVEKMSPKLLENECKNFKNMVSKALTCIYPALVPLYKNFPNIGL
jgi:adenine-specific DNA methylase